LLPTLVFSDPHHDPHRAGRGRIPLDVSASIVRPLSSGWTTTDRRRTGGMRTGNAVCGVTRIEGSNPSRSAKSLAQQQVCHRCHRSLRRLTRSSAKYLTPTTAPPQSSANVGGRSWTAYRISRRNAVVATADSQHGQIVVAAATDIGERSRGSVASKQATQSFPEHRRFTGRPPREFVPACRDGLGFTAWALSHRLSE
jgi:hypothetical protein